MIDLIELIALSAKIRSLSSFIISSWICTTNLIRVLQKAHEAEHPAIDNSENRGEIPSERKGKQSFGKEILPDRG
jgi:hypothetical protein